MSEIPKRVHGGRQGCRKSRNGFMWGRTGCRKFRNGFIGGRKGCRKFRNGFMGGRQGCRKFRNGFMGGRQGYRKSRNGFIWGRQGCRKFRNGVIWGRQGYHCVTESSCVGGAIYEYALSFFHLPTQEPYPHTKPDACSGLCKQTGHALVMNLMKSIICRRVLNELKSHH